MTIFTETPTTYILDLVVQCKECDGTGLYVGFAERNGAAVICRRCDGTGKVTEQKTFNKFQGRQIRDGVKRVFSDGHGYVISSEDVITTEGVNVKFSEYGCTYEEWLNGSTPKPIESLTCPYMHTGQNMQTKSHPQHQMYKECCEPSLKLGSRITDCKCFNKKNQCWKRYYNDGGK